MVDLKKQCGFTIIEVMVAMVIISVALLGLAKLSTSVMTGNSYSRYYTTATVLAQDQFENLMNNSFASLTTGVDVNNPIDENGKAGGLFTRTWTVTNVSATVKTVAVTVTWPDSNAPTGIRQTIISTTIADS